MLRDRPVRPIRCRDARRIRMRLGGALAATAGFALVTAVALRPGAAAEAKPDFALFKERIEPGLQTVCAQ